MNLKIKFRESFRPFAPCVLREHVHDWFEMRPDEDSPYMLLVAPVAERHRVPLSPEDRQKLRTDPDLVRRVDIVRSRVPAVTHVDYSARVQTVDERHGRFYRLLRALHGRTGCPVVVNTSFNLSWEPIVLTPEEAYHTFMQSEMDVLVLEDHLLLKTEQPLGINPWASSETGTVADLDSPWADPINGEPLVVSACAARNPKTGASYQVEAGIPRLLVSGDGRPLASGDRRSSGRAAGAEAPSPSYDGIDGLRALLEKMRAVALARLLNEQIPYSARVLEVGCGTGHLTNFLAIAHRTVLGIDERLDWLRPGQAFKSTYGLPRATFAHMSFRRPALKSAFFDVLVCNDALGRSADGRERLRVMAGLVRLGGHVVVICRNTHNRANRSESPATVDEVLGWLGSAGLEFVNAIPKTIPGSVADREHLFVGQSPGTAVSRRVSRMLRSRPRSWERGVSVVIARRRAESI